MKCKPKFKMHLNVKEKVLDIIIRNDDCNYEPMLDVLGETILELIKASNSNITLTNTSCSSETDLLYSFQSNDVRILKTLKLEIEAALILTEIFKV